ncbi:MAG: PEP/pyruvate-binding domain-containing protein [Myxococcota bacterium]|nr:PEP/pyruvate-binding domain-containing protein [Myxococcota bacterium]
MGTTPDYATQIGCAEDFLALASRPLDAAIPGARSTKTVVDRVDGDALYFQNSALYQTHWEFASAHLSGNGKPIVPQLASFNTTEYYSPSRRFLLGALTYYEGPNIYCYEIAPYDTSTADMITAAYQYIAENAFIQDNLFFHPTSETVELEAAKLPDHIRVISTEELFEGIDYQPLNLGVSMGQLRFLTAEDLEVGNVSFRDIAVLDAVPNDISVVMGIITTDFQTPLSHINVLSQNRGTPNMGLKGAFTDATLRALAGKWVRLDVGPFEYSITEVSKAEADAWWEANKPTEIIVPTMDLTTTAFKNIEDMLDIETLGLGPALAAAIPAYGGKASHFGAFPHMDSQKVPFPKAFAIPIYYYRQFMEENGFDAVIDGLMADEAFQNDPMVRKAALKDFKDQMKLAPIREDFLFMVEGKIQAEYPSIRMRFRSSTNCEDLDGFTGAGLYTSKSGDPSDPAYPVADAIRSVWASVWNFRAFEERAYRSIDHKAVGMALLVHRSFPAEEVNGVAVTGNIFDAQGLEPGFYVNVQVGEVSVVIPPPGVTSDQFILHYAMPGQPIVFIDHSNLVQPNQNVLTRSQILELGAGLDEIHTFFNGLYGPSTPDHFYAMDVEFKFDGDPGETPALFIKQARPYPGWGMN